MDVLLVYTVGRIDHREYCNTLTCGLSEREISKRSTCIAFDMQVALAINDGVEHRDCAFS